VEVLTPNLLRRLPGAIDNTGVRRLVALPTILAFLLASVMAPYRHAHVHSDEHRDDSGREHHDHDDATVVHIHFYSFTAPSETNGKSLVGDAHGGHVSIPLDTFATLSHVAVPLLAKPQSRMLLSFPEEAIAETIRMIEPRGHDPPDLDFSSPRAPPA